MDTAVPITDLDQGEISPEAMSPPAAMRLDEISVHYSRGMFSTRPPIKGVEGVNLSMERGKIYVVLGQSGSGKTSLLKSVSSGFISADAAKARGHVFLDGEAVKKKNLKGDVRIASAFHPQWHPASTLMTEIMRLVRAKNDPANLNYRPPNAVVLDEPTRNIDPSQFQDIAEHLKEIAEDSAVIIATHEIPFALAHGDHLIHLTNGEVIYNGEMDAIRNLSPDVPEETRHYISEGFRLQDKLKAEEKGEYKPPVALDILEGKREVPAGPTVLKVEGLSVSFNASDPKKRLQAVSDVSFEVRQGETFALIGPSGCGKSTLMKAFNMMLLVPDVEVTGKITLEGQDIYEETDPVMIRRMFGYVAQKAQCWPHMSMMKEVSYPAVIHGLIPNTKEARTAHATKLLKQVGLWEEVQDRFDKDSGTSLSGGQQQRLCIARAISADPKIILMDEPCSALDPISTAKIENLMGDLARQGYTIAIVTHSMEQGARTSDSTGFMYLGEMVEQGDTGDIFLNPQEPKTQRFLTRRTFG